VGGPSHGLTERAVPSGWQGPSSSTHYSVFLDAAALVGGRKQLWRILRADWRGERKAGDSEETGAVSRTTSHSIKGGDARAWLPRRMPSESQTSIRCCQSHGVMLRTKVAAAAPQVGVSPPTNLILNAYGVVGLVRFVVVVSFVDGPSPKLDIPANRFGVG
jgi:hypothetical protein